MAKRCALQKPKPVSRLSSLQRILSLVLEEIGIDKNTCEMPRLCLSITSKNKLCTSLSCCHIGLHYPKVTSIYYPETSTRPKAQPVHNDSLPSRCIICFSHILNML